MKNKTFRILSYNVRLFGGITGDKIGKAYMPEARLDALIATLLKSDMDVIGLCEVWDQDYKKAISEGVGSVYPFSYLVEEAEKGRYYGSGLMLLSRYAIMDPSFTLYSNSDGNDSLANKGYVHAWMNVPQVESTDGFDRYAPVDVFLTHMQSNSDNSHVRARKGQIRQLKDSIQKIQAESIRTNHPTFLIGDLNVIGEVGGNPKTEYEYMS